MMSKTFSSQTPKGWSIIANFTPQIIKCQAHLLRLIQVSPAVLKEQFTQKLKKLCDYLLIFPQPCVNNVRLKY